VWGERPERVGVGLGGLGSSGGGLSLVLGEAEKEPWAVGSSCVVLEVPVLVVPVVVVPVPLVLAFEVVKIVIDRSGIVLSPEFETASVRFVFRASACLLGKSALTI
jgi:hypothetical protein